MNSELVVNHKNGIKTDNRLENLEVITQGENLQHAYNLGLRKTRKVIQLDINGNIINTYNSIKEASKTTSISTTSITSVCKGRRITTGGFKWAYLD